MGGLGYTCQTDLHPGAEPWRLPMTAIAKVLSRASGTRDETFQTVAIFCGVGLLVSLFLLLTGLDSSAGFF
jgi:predicted molibdopterin-dependent oxidoreductase YjgC